MGNSVGVELKEVAFDDKTLMAALEEGDLEIIKRWKPTAQDIDKSRTKFGQNALDIAILHNHLEVVRLLVALGADIRMWLYKAVRYNESELCLALIEKKPMTYLNQPLPYSLSDVSGNSAIHLAIKFECWDVFQLLLKLGVDLNIRNNTGETPLVLLLDKPPADSKKVELMLKKGTKLHIKSKYENGKSINVLSRLLNQTYKVYGNELLINNHEFMQTFKLVCQHGGGLGNLDFDDIQLIKNRIFKSKKEVEILYYDGKEFITTFSQLKQVPHLCQFVQRETEILPEVQALIQSQVSFNLINRANHLFIALEAVLIKQNIIKVDFSQKTITAPSIQDSTVNELKKTDEKMLSFLFFYKDKMPQNLRLEICKLVVGGGHIPTKQTTEDGMIKLVRG